MRLKFKKILCCFVLTFIFLMNGCLVADEVCGASKKNPESFFSEASPQARALVERAWRDLPDKIAYDVHVHVIDDNEKENGCFINPSSKTILQASHYVKMRAYLSAGRVKDRKIIGDQYIGRLVKLARNCGRPIRLHVLAFDKNYDRGGRVVMSKTEFYVSNEYVMALARAYPDVFVPVISVHPYRQDALAELEKWADQGVKMVKWLPSVQGIDPADASIVPFYQAMKRRNMVLLVHAGKEHALDSHGRDDLDNPLLLRKPLDCGVKVIISHCASAGKNKDLDDPQKNKARNFDLFLRLMDEKKYEGLLFADVSTITQRNRMDEALATLLTRKDLHPRLVNGSDYPLPGLKMLISTEKLAKKGYITRQEQKALKEIYTYNPLLFDFVLRRIARSPGSRLSFSSCVFQNNPVELH